MSKRLAGFGGVGGQTAPFAPGSSPLFRGGPSGYAGFGVDSFSSDISLDSLMERSHKPKILGFERPLESLLESFHDNLEKDAVPYLLDFDERIKLDKKQKIRKKEQYLKDIREQDAANDKTEQIIKRLKTVERLLDEFRKNDDIDFSKNAGTRKAAVDMDEASEESRLKKYRSDSDDSFYRTRASLPTVDSALSSVDEYKAEGDPLNMTNNRLTEPFTGIAPHYTPEDGLDTYMRQLADPKNVDMHAYFDGLINTPDPTENITHSVKGTLFDEPSPITPESKQTNINLEEKLQKMKQQGWTPNRLDPDMFSGIDWDKKTKGTWQERTTTNQTPYNNDTLGNLDNSQEIGQFTSNNPYNMAAGLMK